MKKGLIVATMMAILIAGANIAPADGWDPNSRFSNLGSIVNSRHNLSQVPLGFGISIQMNAARNQYEEVCVYCHTPHGANTTIDAPLWNRTNKGNTYTLYNIPLTSGQTPTQPGVSSLTCLSCHDGTVAIDSIVNMPGSGGYDTSQQTQSAGPAASATFLNTWNNAAGADSSNHLGLNSRTNITGTTLGDGTGSQGCINCHSELLTGTGPMAGSGPDFTVFNLGTDLTNDHPVGVQLPDTNIYDFNAPTATNASLKFYDTNGNTRVDPNEIRFYNTGEGYEVECASCHDPHGVPSGGPGTNTLLRPSFLRISNAGSAVCLTCHNK